MFNIKQINTKMMDFIFFIVMIINMKIFLTKLILLR